MKRFPVEEFARSVPQATVDSVRKATSNLTSARVNALAKAFKDPDDARQRAAEIKNYVLDNLKTLLVDLEAKCKESGIQVHWATDAASARQIILDICKTSDPADAPIVKAKSMATEEIHLNSFLEEQGYRPVETDLGEYVVQLDHDTPSHIVAPIIHRSKKQVSDTFEKEGLGARSEDPATLAMQARERLRSYFRKARVGISGINFAIAETGRLVLIENEGNNRLSTTAPHIHIAVMGIEKILPRESDLPLFIRLLVCSATGQQMPTYTHLISGPSAQGEHGPKEVHLVLLDNGRSKVLAGKYKDILRCIRCGACLNVCPVYRQSTGHSYGHVYSGPIGAVLAPALEGVDKLGYLAKASSLCGACEEVCPVRIPIPRMLLELRDEAHKAGSIPDDAPWHLFAKAAISGWKWRAGLKLLPMAERMPHPLKNAWAETRALPRRTGRSFRSWWHERS